MFNEADTQSGPHWARCNLNQLSSPAANMYLSKECKDSENRRLRLAQTLVEGGGVCGRALGRLT